MQNFGLMNVYLVCLKVLRKCITLTKHPNFRKKKSEPSVHSGLEILRVTIRKLRGVHVNFLPFMTSIQKEVNVLVFVSLVIKALGESEKRHRVIIKTVLRLKHAIHFMIGNY